MQGSEQDRAGSGANNPSALAKQLQQAWLQSRIAKNHKRSSSTLVKTPAEKRASYQASHRSSAAPLSSILAPASNQTVFAPEQLAVSNARRAPFPERSGLPMLVSCSRKTELPQRSHSTSFIEGTNSWPFSSLPSERAQPLSLSRSFPRSESQPNEFHDVLISALRTEDKGALNLAGQRNPLRSFLDDFCLEEEMEEKRPPRSFLDDLCSDKEMEENRRMMQEGCAFQAIEQELADLIAPDSLSLDNCDLDVSDYDTSGATTVFSPTEECVTDRLNLAYTCNLSKHVMDVSMCSESMDSNTWIDEEDTCSFEEPVWDSYLDSWQSRPALSLEYGHYLPCGGGSNLSIEAFTNGVPSSGDLTDLLLRSFYRSLPPHSNQLWSKWEILSLALFRVLRKPFIFFFDGTHNDLEQPIRLFVSSYCYGVVQCSLSPKLASPLCRCANAANESDVRTFKDLIGELQQHSSAYGSAPQRMAYYFMEALVAKMSGTGAQLHTALTNNSPSAATLLKCYRRFVDYCPYPKISHFFFTKTILDAFAGASHVHLIDYGMLDGFQWPCLIHHLSQRRGGPPHLRITAIGDPNPRYTRFERIQKTCRRLEAFAKMWNVSFEYQVVVGKWETITPTQLALRHDEVVAISCFYRLRHILDESIMGTSPRKLVLNMIRSMNPKIFVEGVINAGYNAPFFKNRIRESIKYFSNMFDAMEVSIPTDDPDRVVLEQDMYGRDILNIVACEGLERVERAEPYRQWQSRMQRAGFTQVPLRPIIIRKMKGMMASYHKDYGVGEDGEWFLMGWKNQIVRALSVWEPTQSLFGA